MNSGIYEIVNTTNWYRYIGSAVNISGRWRQHKSDLMENKHHSRHLQNAWNKYGTDVFVFQVIELCKKDALIEREQHYMDTLKPEYNIAPMAGNSLGVKHTPEACANMSAAMIGKKKPPFTVEHRANMSVWQKGKKKSPETCVKISTAQMGNKNSLGHKQTPEHIAKKLAAYMGNKNVIAK